MIRKKKNVTSGSFCTHGLILVRCNSYIYDIAGIQSIYAAKTPPITRYVANGGTDGGGDDCTSPGSPCSTIAHAVSEATVGDTLDIAPGSYAAPGLIEKELNVVATGVIVL